MDKNVDVEQVLSMVEMEDSITRVAPGVTR